MPQSVACTFCRTILVVGFIRMDNSIESGYDRRTDTMHNIGNNTKGNILVSFTVPVSFAAVDATEYFWH
jgi:hypothetical protein